MKTLATALLLVAAVVSTPVSAQTKTVAHPAKPASPGTASTARPATAKATTSKAVTKPASKPAATTKPVPKPAPTPAPEAAATATAVAEPIKSASSTSAKTADGMAANGELFHKGSTMANVGLGLGLGYGYYGTFKSTPAMSLSVEHGVAEGIGPGTIGIGGLVGYKGFHYDYPGTNYKSTWSNIIVAARGTYHYNVFENPKLDTYGGISLGVRIQKWTDTYYDEIPELKGYSSSTAYLTSGIFVGARYFLSDNIGAFTELGYDMSYLKIGITARF
jgi:hypothetical protein